MLLLISYVRLRGTNTALPQLDVLGLDSTPALYEQSLGLLGCTVDGRSVLLPALSCGGLS